MDPPPSYETLPKNASTRDRHPAYTQSETIQASTTTQSPSFYPQHPMQIIPEQGGGGTVGKIIAVCCCFILTALLVSAIATGGALYKS
ncbi:hypothetical protein PFISCL1PPCAC_14288 [Pristionchus fissidentatus]|uniref:Uncharacterized protein n=1 Tax=Pristionchus fissidentatus TaxID=1538716 RepID=A0AAV5VU37_9BILA|nr:hypothetical protein PFISCL1PPCAC_14288 [Pristionchus fissidentatus]